MVTMMGNGPTGDSLDGGPVTEARLNYSRGSFLDGTGNIYIADWGNYRIRKVDASGIVTTIAGITQQTSFILISKHERSSS